MNTNLLKSSVIGTVFCFLAMAANLSAAPSLVSFTVSGFDPAAPQSVVSGSILVEIDDVTKKVTSISEVTLTLNGHAFTIAEVGFSEYRNYNIVGAQGEGLGSLSGISHGSPYDFWLLWNKDTGLPREFAYTGSVDAIHSSRQFDLFTIVPVP